MKAIILLASASLVAAQLFDASNVPQCAISCLLPALSSTGCGLSDLSCACLPKNQDTTKAQAAPCIEKACSKDDLAKALDSMNSVCGGTSTSAATDTPTSKSSPPTTTTSADASSESSKSATTTSTTSADASSGSSKSVTTTSTGGDSSGSLSATSTSASTPKVETPSTLSTTGNSEPTPSATSTQARNGPLPTTTGQSKSSGGGLSKAATAGIGVGAGLGGLAIITGLAWLFYARGKEAGKKSRDVEETTTFGHQNNTSTPKFASSPPTKPVLEVGGTPVAELPG